MPFEIELKAWADDIQPVRGRLSRLGRSLGDFQKEDVYWRPGKGPLRNAETPGVPLPEVRVRRERMTGQESAPGKILVTFKMKEVRDGVEVNRENEFQILDTGGGIAALEALLSRFGLEPQIRKLKRGGAWDCGGVTAELHEVEGLGHFLELEILSDNEKPETVRKARARLLDLLEKCGIGAEKIESRYYTEMLEKAEQGEDIHG